MFIDLKELWYVIIFSETYGEGKGHEGNQNVLSILGREGGKDGGTESACMLYVQKP